MHGVGVKGDYHNRNTGDKIKKQKYQNVIDSSHLVHNTIFKQIDLDKTEKHLWKC